MLNLFKTESNSPASAPTRFQSGFKAFGALLAAYLAFLPARGALGAPPTQIQVTLFGQTCALSGPYPAKTLELIHAVSPEKIPPSQTFEQAKASLSRLESAASRLPAQLAPYQKAMSLRLGGQIAFLDAIATVRKSGKNDRLISAIKPYVPERKLSDLSAKIRKVTKWTPAAVEQLDDAFLESLGEYPEEDFHRALQKMKVEYLCSHGETGDDDEDDAEAAE